MKVRYRTVLIIMFVFALAGGIVWVWQNNAKHAKLGEQAKLDEQTGLEQQLQEIERQIALTQEQLEELEKLTPEQRAQREREQEILTAKSALDDVVVEGVEVSKLDGTKLVQNRAQGYSIEVPSNLLIARSVSSDWLEFHDRELMCQGDPLCEPVIRIVVEARNQDQLSLEQWFSAEERDARAAIFTPRQKLTIRNQTVYKVEESIPGRFEGFYYYWSKGENIYYLRISGVDDSLYRSFIETLNFE